MDNKLLMTRDVILAFMMKEELTVDEAREVLHMCRNEIDANINRMKIREVTIPEKEVIDNPSEVTGVTSPPLTQGRLEIVDGPKEVE